MAAELVHLRPVVANDDVTDVANPNFLPDFDHNGVFGDPGDFVAMEQGAQGAQGLGSPSTHPASGAFLYPCIADSGAVTYETTTNACAAAGVTPHHVQDGVRRAGDDHRLERPRPRRHALAPGCRARPDDGRNRTPSPRS